MQFIGKTHVGMTPNTECVSLVSVFLQLEKFCIAMGFFFRVVFFLAGC